MKTDSSFALRGRFAARIRPRGYTLVEIALAMLVIGLLLGASALTARHLEERRQLQREIQKMERVRDAIVGYALRNRTTARVLKIVPAFGPPAEWTFRLPAGRPYLPCPDYDGDGYEDRIPLEAFPQGIAALPNLTITITVGTYLGDNPPSLVWVNRHTTPYVSPPYGECLVSRGTAPWRTLGVEPADSWGNRHTYFADSMFSNAMFGFDRQTIADIYDRRLPTVHGFSPGERPPYDIYPISRDLRTFGPIPFPRGRGYNERDVNRNCPAAICVANSACEPSSNPSDHPRAIGNSNVFIYATLDRCAWQKSAGSARQSATFKAGLVAPEEIDDERWRFPAGSVTDGLPFVLVSHGPNGRFAVNHWGTLQNPIADDTGLLRPRKVRQPFCNPVRRPRVRPPGRSYQVDISQHPPSARFEAANAVRVLHPWFVYTSGTATCLDPDIFRDGERRFYNTAFFVWRPPGSGDNGDFDDLLMWMTRGELIGAVRGNIPRLPRMAIAYFPECPEHILRSPVSNDRRRRCAWPGLFE